MDNAPQRHPARVATHVASLVPLGLAVALLLALGLGSVFAHPLQRGAVSPVVSQAVVPVDSPTIQPTSPVGTPSTGGGTATKATCPSLDPSSGCTIAGVPDWLLAVIGGVILLVLIVLAVTRSQTVQVNENPPRDRP